MGVSQADGVHQPGKASQNTLIRRIGWQAVGILTTALLSNVAIAGFIGFLWFADMRNNVWYQIMITGWATRAITISTLVLRFSIDLQAGIAAAMLAAVVLEVSSVRLHDVAKVSTMRASNPQPRALLDLIPALSGQGWFSSGLKPIGYSVAVLLLFGTTTTLQFSSTLFLSDLRLGRLPDLPVQRSAAYDFEHTTSKDVEIIAPGLAIDNTFIDDYPLQRRGPTWLRNPPAFPAFAEYSKDIDPIDGVDDTGVLLRAFLPFADAQSRESLQNYSGDAFVLDTRVSCQRPQLTDVSLSSKDSKPREWGITGRMTGTFEPSNRDVERLWTPGPVDFDCSVYLNREALSICQVTWLSPWTDTFTESGGLLSEFWHVTDVKDAISGGLRLWQMPMLVVQSHNRFTAGNSSTKVVGTEPTNGYWTNVSTLQQTWSLSICYSSWYTANLVVNISSSGNRSEPLPFWNRDKGYFTQPDVHNQLGELQDGDTSTAGRGILKLGERASWIPEDKDLVPTLAQPFVQQFADTNQQGIDLPLPFTCDECSAFMELENETLYRYMPPGMFHADYTLVSLFRQTLGQNRTGSLARAMSSLITILSSMAYYDQLPQFEKTSNTTQVYFTTVLYPQSYLGFWAVMIVLGVHTALVGIITLGFSVFSRHTLLGNHWQSIAHLYGPETQSLILDSRMATDKEAKEILRGEGNDDLRVGIRTLRDRRKVGLHIVGDSAPSPPPKYVSVQQP